MKKLLALVLALVMTLSLCVTSNAAYVGEEYDYDEAVEVMSAVGVFQGDENGKFNGKQELTREQAAKLIAYLDLGEKVAEALPAIKVFNDVEATRWSAKYVAYCANAGYLAGVGDNNFDPAGKLTGYAFSKMLLCVLGYDATAEGLTGSDWAINVAKLCVQRELDEDIVDYSGAKTMTREEAAKMVFNTMLRTTVTYNGTNQAIQIGDVTITNKGEAVVGTTLGSLLFKANYSKLHLKNGDIVAVADGKATLTDADEDAFGRTANTWYYGTTCTDDTKIGTYGIADAKFVYTATTKASVVKADLKGFTYAAGLKATVNSDAQNATISDYTAVAALTKDGKTVEIYATNSVIDQIIVVETAKATVSAVNDTKKTFSIQFTNGGTQTVVIDADSAFYGLYGTVKKDDVLAVSFANDNTVLDLYVPEKVEGAVSYVKGDQKQATVAGTTYKAYNEDTLFAAGDLGDDVVLYLTKTGYVFAKEAPVASDAQYIFVTNTWRKDASAYGETKYKQYVKGVLTDGTVVEWEVANEWGKADTNDFAAYASYGKTDACNYHSTTAGQVAIFANSTAVNKVYEYTQKTDGKAVYLLTNPTTATANSGYGTAEGVVTRTQAAVGAKASKIDNIFMASNVTYVYVYGQGEDLKSATGAKADLANTVYHTAVVEKVGNKNVVTVVFVESSTIATADTVLVAKNNGSVKYTDANGDKQTGFKVDVYKKNATETTEMIVNAATAGVFYTTEANGEGYELTDSAATAKENAAITGMYNGYATVGTEFNFNDVTVVDYSDNGIDSVAALESAVNTDNQEVKVSFLYDASNKVETVYVMSVKSTDVGIKSVTVNGVAATLEDTAVNTNALTIAKDTALTIEVETDDAKATVAVTYDNDGTTYAAFTNGVSKTKNADSTTGYFKIVVTAENGATATKYVAFKTPA